MGSNIKKLKEYIFGKESAEIEAEVNDILDKDFTCTMDSLSSSTVSSVAAQSSYSTGGVGTYTAGTGIGIGSSGSYTTVTAGTGGGGIVGGNVATGQWVTTTIPTGGFTYTAPSQIFSNPYLNSSNNAFIVSNSGKEIVRLNKDGSVTWDKEINVDEAAAAFARSINLGAEMMAGITQGVKHRMRDSVFNDLIEIAKEKGSLSADDLTYLLSAAKIVEKLKGPRE
jgi:hypothetical protein